MKAALRRLLWVSACALCAASCSSYRDFTLPAQSPAAAIPEWRWELRSEPVVARGPAGSWDAVDALNPSVVFHNGLYYNLYSGYDGETWHTGLAISKDGIDWQKHGVVISPDPTTWEGDYIAANGHLELVDEEFLYWYQAGHPPRIGLARSKDGRAWEKRPAPVMSPGPRGAWDERGVADPYVLAVEGKLYLFYLGQDRARRQRLGVAVSDDGIAWHKLRSSPILDLGPAGAFDETGLGEPAVWLDQGRYWMLYTARDRHEHRRLGLAVSSDGVSWERVTNEPFLEGPQTWNAKVVCDPTVLVSGNEIHVWFGGGDEPRPAENLNGQIGYGVLVPSE